MFDFLNNKTKINTTPIVDEIEAAVYAHVKPYGFKKYGRTLHRFVSEDISQVIHFQSGLPRHKRAEPTRPKSLIFPILGRFSPCNTDSIATSKKHPITEKLKLLGCFAVLKSQIFVGTRKKTKQCCRIARLFDDVTAKRGHFKTVSVRLSYAYAWLERTVLREFGYSHSGMFRPRFSA